MRISQVIDNKQINNFLMRLALFWFLYAVDGKSLHAAGGKDGCGHPNQGNDDTLDSDPIDGTTGIYTLTSGQTNSTVDAGFMPLASLGGRAFSDADSDGIQDTGEAGIGSVTVRLLDGSGASLLGSTTTDANGSYSFGNLVPGSYRVQFFTPNLLLASPANQGNDDNVDSDPVGGVTSTYALTSGQTNSSVDAGFMPLASLGGRAFSDADSDGIQDAGEAGLSGVTVWLLPGSGSGWLATTTTNANGFYSFANLTAGSYRVQFDTPNLLLTSPADQGNDDTLDSDPVNGVTGSYTLTSGQTNSTVDAGWIF